MSLFRYHLNDIHDLATSQREVFHAQKNEDVKRIDQSMTNINVQRTDINNMRKKKRKPNNRTEPIFIAWSPPPFGNFRSISSQPKAFTVKLGRKRKLSRENTQSCAPEDYLFDVLAAPEKQLLSDQDIVCDFLSDSYPALRRNDVDSSSNLTLIKTLKESAKESVVRATIFFECICIPINPALLFTSDNPISPNFTEVCDKSVAIRKPHTFRGTADKALCENNSSTSAVIMRDIAAGSTAEMPCQDSSSMSIIVMHDLAKDTSASQIKDHILSSNQTEKSKREKSFSILSCVETSPVSHIKVQIDLAFRCPICNRNVEGPINNKFMNFSQQTMFCENHQKRKAELK